MLRAAYSFSFLSIGGIAQPAFNFEGETRGIYCFDHKETDMIDVKSNKCLKCEKIPVFNFEGETRGIYCFDHKETDMIDVISNKCIKCEITRASSYRNEGCCLRCFINFFPEKPVFRNHKIKERDAVLFVLNNFPDATWIEDKRVADGCSYRRPDLLLHLGYQVIIVEIDENQHYTYDPSCENRRMRELHQDVDNYPLVFLRFNPDKYDDVKSCWTQNCHGIDVLHKDRVAEWGMRLETLKREIEFHMREENRTMKGIQIVRLFYDT
jgi:EsV-1-7 cysteine-rich motif